MLVVSWWSQSTQEADPSLHVNQLATIEPMTVGTTKMQSMMQMEKQQIMQQ